LAILAVGVIMEAVQLPGPVTALTSNLSNRHLLFSLTACKDSCPLDSDRPNRCGVLDEAIFANRAIVHKSREVSDPVFEYFQGCSYWREGRVGEAVAAWAKVGAFAKLMEAGQILTERGDQAQGLVAFDGAIDLHPQDVVPYLHKIRLLRDMGRYDEAYTLGLWLVDQYSVLPDPWQELSQVAEAEGDYDAALLFALRGLERSPNNSSLQVLLGRILIERGANSQYPTDHTEARKWLIKALRIDPCLADSEFWIGISFARANDLEIALVHFERAIQLNSQRWEFHWWAGEMLYKLQRYPEASVEYSLVLTLNPDNQLARERVMELSNGTSH
jgi:tetratricopeptide (TPR) repeat protein